MICRFSVLLVIVNEESVFCEVVMEFSYYCKFLILINSENNQQINNY